MKVANRGEARSEKKIESVKNEILDKDNKKNNRKRKINTYEKSNDSEDDFETKIKRVTRSSVTNAKKTEDANVKNSSETKGKAIDLKKFERVQPTQLRSKLVSDNENTSVKNKKDKIQKGIKTNRKHKAEKNESIDFENGFVTTKTEVNDETSKVINKAGKSKNNENKDSSKKKKANDFTKLKEKSDIKVEENEKNKGNTRNKQTKKLIDIENGNRQKNNYIKNKKKSIKAQKQSSKLEKNTSKKPKVKDEEDEDSDDEEEEEDNNDNDLIDEDYQPNDDEDEDDWEEVKG